MFGQAGGPRRRHLVAGEALPRSGGRLRAAGFSGSVVQVVGLGRT